MSHSKFPWSTHPQAPTNVYDASGMKVSASLGPDAEDNAALIAAIPAMVQALEDIGRQNLSREMEQEHAEMADFESAYDAIIQVARAALASLPAPEAAPTTREEIAKIIDPDAKFEDIEGVQWSKFELQRRELAYLKADAILALKAAPAK